jgi:site-specific recombinase XerC
MDLESFMTSLSADTHSAETLRAYRWTLGKFQSFLRERGLRVTQVKPKIIKEFKAHLEAGAGRPLAAATICRHYAILASFFSFLEENSDGKIRNPMDRVKRPTVSNDLPRAVDNFVLSSLLDGVTDARDKAIILTFLYSGLRLSELTQLNRDSITPCRRESVDGNVEWYGYGEVIGKGNKPRDFRVGPKVLDALRNYILLHRRNDTDPALFLSSRKKRISGRTVQAAVDAWCKRLHLPHIHVHQLRHSFATRNVNAGMQLPVLQSLMGHKNPHTTGRYFRVDSDRKTREYFGAMEYLADTSDV